MKTISSITIVYASADGSIISISRARTNASNQNVCERLVSSDIDAFLNTSFNNKPGCYVDIISQESPDHLIPDHVWHQYWDLLCMRIQHTALLRNATCSKHYEPLPSPVSKPGKKCVITDIPLNGPLASLRLNGQDMRESLTEMVGPNKANAIMNDICNTNNTKDTYDPNYKDSDIPDDIHLHEFYQDLNDDEPDFPG